jgi:hypothetical protein
MARPTAGTLTGAGFSLENGAKYSKVTGTAKAVVDLGAGTDKTGVAGIQSATPGTPITAADWAAHVATLGALGIMTGGESPGGGLVYYGQSV